jgi:NAD-dependent deacetylase
MIVVGTSLAVSPANTLSIYAQQNDATLIEITPENTAMSSEMDLVINNSSTITLPKLTSLFKEIKS